MGLITIIFYMSEGIVISENNIAQDDVDRVNELMLQLSPAPKKLDFEKIQKVMDGGLIFAARNEEGLIIGMASLIPARKLFAYFGTIEDVIVDENSRGLGLGKALTNKIIERAKELQMDYLDLTSSPEREAANGLYRSVGFEKRNTNVYRMRF